MTAGPFIMTNLEGLFSPFRELEAEMDELRTMRRVSQIWHEMEQREHGAWMMFGRFFDKEVDGIHQMSSPSWGSSLFTHSRPNLFGSRRNESSTSSTKSDNRVLVEFPDEEKEIKITLEEPSVVITEVEDSPEPVDIHASGYSSPLRKFSEANSNENNSIFSDSLYDVTSVSSVREDHAERTIDPVTKTEKVEKRTKKVDFSKVEVHFEPGSGRVNIVETNEKPPSNQLFRKKRRHRNRSDSPKLNFVGNVDQDSYDNTLSNSFIIDEEHGVSSMNSNLKFDHLSSDLDLSIFNLRNTLFKNSIEHFDKSNSNNLLISSDFGRIEERDFSGSKLPTNSQDNILLDKNLSYSKSSFCVSSKLQSMIKNSVKDQIGLKVTQKDEVKDINIMVENGQKINKFVKSNSIVKSGNNDSPSNTLKSHSHSLKRNNSRSKENAIPVSIELNVHSKNVSLKQSLEDDKNASRRKIPVNRVDSFKKSSRVSRQESQRSTSSKGSISSDKYNPRKGNNLIKDPSKKEIATGKINRSPSIGKLTSNSLKKGGIYVDGSHKKRKGTTITLISYTSGDRTLKQTDSLSKGNFNNITVNNLESFKDRNRIVRKESVKSNCSKESLASAPNKFAQKKIDISKDFYGRSSPKCKEISSQTNHNNILRFTGTSNNLNNTTNLTHIRNAQENHLKFKKSLSKNAAFVKRDSFKYGSKNSVESLDSNKIKKIQENDYSNQSITQESFHHEDSSLFQPIKKEKPLHFSKVHGNEIKTPVAIRKKSNIIELGSDSNNKQTEVCRKLSRTNSKEKNNVRHDLKYSRSPPLKSNVTSLRRSKEPLRSFEKISNGWVGRCNISAVQRSGKSGTEWTTVRTSEIKLPSHNNTSEYSSGVFSRESASPVTSNHSSSRVTVHQQKEAAIRLSRGQPSRLYDTGSFSRNSIDSRKRSRHVYTPSSVSSYASSIPTGNKRRPESSTRSGTPISSEPVYESLNSRRKASSTTITKRTKQPNPCCNI